MRPKKVIGSLFRKDVSASQRLPTVPDDLRVYAIGDIHGCDVEFAQLLEQIDSDHERRVPKQQIIVLLGDLVDRGPDSASVVERALRLTQTRQNVWAVAGNHEELLMLSCGGDERALRVFARNGGRETAISYGIDPAAYDAADFDGLHRLLDAHVPASHREFIANMKETVEIGDYAFVHAGIRPGVPLAKQRGSDLRWIRDRFLEHDAPHERFIVHGHTISTDVDERPNRLGIDTGAYLTGHLTAVGLEDDRRWFLST